LDVSGYLSAYRDFIGYNIGITSDFEASTGLPSNIQAYRYAANSKNQVVTRGFNFGVHYYISDHHTINFNYSYNELLKVSGGNESNSFFGRDDDGTINLWKGAMWGVYPVPLSQPAIFDPIIPAFNTPKHKYNIGLSGEKLFTATNGNEWGYSLNYKWIQGFLFEGSPQFTGLIPTYDLVDAQVNYQVKKLRLNIKLGASNLFNNMQFQTYGGPRIGRLAYLSLRYEFQKTK
jgi:outer membrane receptor for ferrienterochelin and colicin